MSKSHVPNPVITRVWTDNNILLGSIRDRLMRLKEVIGVWFVYNSRRTGLFIASVWEHALALYAWKMEVRKIKAAHPQIVDPHKITFSRKVENGIVWCFKPVTVPLAAAVRIIKEIFGIGGHHEHH